MESQSIGGSAQKIPSWLISFLSGGIAGTVAKSACAPLERVKILFQIRSVHYPYAGVVKTLQSIYYNEGVIGLWKGNTATIVRIFPYAAVQFMAFEKYKTVREAYLEASKRKGIDSCWDSFCMVIGKEDLTL